MRTYEQNRRKIQSGTYDMWLDADLPEDEDGGDNREEDDAEIDYQVDRILDAQISVGMMIE